MSEKNLWKYLRQGMTGRWHASRHEGLEPGTPDLSYGLDGVNGWIELKYLAAWPKRAVIPRLRHLTIRQRRWLERRGRHGGSCWLLLQVGREYLLFDWRNLTVVGRSSVEILRLEATGHWLGGINWNELTDVLSGRAR